MTETTQQLDLELEIEPSKLAGKPRIRGFYKAFDSEVANTEGFKKPRRSTRKSAGYDLYNNTGVDIILPPNKTSGKISTGVIAYMLDDEYFSIFVRSGHGFKYSARLANSTGIIDSDYLKEIFIKIRNPYDEPIVIKAGDAIAQGIFMKYLISDDDEDTVGGERTGGFGSTDSKKG
jgi:dUTP pyrophosphatase